jgi:hypothetical protein
VVRPDRADFVVNPVLALRVARSPADRLIVVVPEPPVKLGSKNPAEEERLGSNHFSGLKSGSYNGLRPATHHYSFYCGPLS